MATHEVTNQAPPLENYNLFESDPALMEAVEREGARWHLAALSRDGTQLGKPETLALASAANRHEPELFTFSPRGERIDAIEFHPSWHQLLTLLRAEGLHALPFEQPQPGAMPARCAGYFLHAQLESGSLCPLTMTFASIPVLQREPALYAALRDQLLSREHDPRDIPLAQKRSMMVGMGMTEKQGGSDVRSNQTRAFAVEGEGRGAAYRLVGHKWFFSAPQCDAHLVLARSGMERPPRSLRSLPPEGASQHAWGGPARAETHEGLSCFFVPRFAPDGTKNPVQIQRLKDKLGNRSNASSEVEFLDAYGVMIGDEGRGVPTIIEMANYTRLDCVIGSAALMRAALVQAIHHARHRAAFGKKLVEQPLMRNVLADLALESEAATVLFMRLARAYDSDPAAAMPEDRAWRRIVTPAAKFWICKRTLEFTGEAMEVWGGNGYVEEGPMARFYREAPVNSIWEGSGNVMCLDVLRAIERDPEGAQALLAAWLADAQGHPALRAALERLAGSLAAAPDALEAGARRIAQQLVLAAQAVLLLRHAPAPVADAFIATRLADGAASAAQCGRVYGTLPASFDHAAIVARAFAA
ncbi:DNA alkylation response protein [Trinickia terrae]|uniref:DNA alkylation response protein n=1 Tax=Trinickia terrae TaxID=2571161 RepID=A0A4V6WQ02_9BURK|nr:acyl-CoA dehydrogenase family protein [Trinickia terrae]TKC78190.1 DNA alkylation response protein [Trinickia terrae]